MMHFNDIKEILSDLSYRDWEFYLGCMDDGFYLQVRFYGFDAVTDKYEEQRCRKWYLSRHMTRSEIVQTAWAAVQAAEMHEARELFRYKGATIFKPHFDVEDLVPLAKVSTEVRA